MGDTFGFLIHFNASAYCDRCGFPANTGNHRNSPACREMRQRFQARPPRWSLLLFMCLATSSARRWAAILRACDDADLRRAVVAAAELPTFRDAATLAAELVGEKSAF